MKFMIFFFSLLLIFTSFLSVNGYQQKADHSAILLSCKINLEGVKGRIDHMAVDPNKSRLFVAALGNNTVEIIDLKSCKQIDALKGIEEPQGISFIPDIERLLVASGGDGKCRIYDSSLKLVGQIDNLEDADNVRYDSKAKESIVGYGNSKGALAFINPLTGTKIDEIELDAHPESFQLEKNGNRIFVNVPKAGNVTVIDRVQRKVIAKWKLTDAQANFPMALDEDNHRLFIGCRKPAKLLVLDTDSGKTVASMDIVGDTDDIFYDDAAKLIYISGGNGSMIIIHQSDADHYEKIEEVETATGGRTSLFDRINKKLYVAIPNKDSHSAQIIVFSTSAPLILNQATPFYKDFNNGIVSENIRWLDNRGELINAHDGGIIYMNGTYYWYGMALRAMGIGRGGNNGAATTLGITLYSSKDLYNWKYEGVILSCSANPNDPLYGPMRFERPKMIYNTKTKKFVLWFHYVKYPGDHADSIGYADAGVASSDSITGPFIFHGIQRPVEKIAAVKDCTLFQEEDGTAYFIYDHKLPTERCLYIVKLSDDYLHCTDVWSKIEAGKRREAPALLKHNGYYFLITSGVSGWNVNPARYYRSKNISGPYEDMGNPCEGPDSATTYNSQPTYVLPIAEKPGSYIMMLERHNTNDFSRCSYIWLPIEFTSAGTLKFKYLERWKL